MHAGLKHYSTTAKPHAPFSLSAVERAEQEALHLCGDAVPKQQIPHRPFFWDGRIPILFALSHHRLILCAESGTCESISGREGTATAPS